MLDMLSTAGMQGPDLDLLARSFAAVDPPFASGEFRKQSNWYQIGTRLAEALRRAGRGAEAGEVSRLIGG